MKKRTLTLAEYDAKVAKASREQLSADIVSVGRRSSPQAFTTGREVQDVRPVTR